MAAGACASTSSSAPAPLRPADPDTSEAEDGLLPTTTSPVDPAAPVSKDSKPAAPGKPDPKDSKPGAPGKADPKGSKPGAPGKPDPEDSKPVSEDSKPVPEDSKPAAPLPGGRSRFGTPELK